jgi:hypothetical protein
MAGELFFVGVKTLSVPAVIQSRRRMNGIWVSVINEIMLKRKNEMFRIKLPQWPLHHKSHMDWSVVKFVQAV